MNEKSTGVNHERTTVWINVYRFDGRLVGTLHDSKAAAELNGAKRPERVARMRMDLEEGVWQDSGPMPTHSNVG
jgi:hypothetical protein